MRVSSHLFTADFEDSPYALIGHGYSGALTKIDKAVAHRLVAARGGAADGLVAELGGQTRDFLVSQGYLTALSHDEEVGIVKAISAQLHAKDLASAPVGIMFVPAYTCNLRCPYCFQSHDLHKGKGRYATIMSEDLVDAGFAVAERLARPGDFARHAGVMAESDGGEREGRPFDQVGLFGGEPMSASTVGIVTYIVREAQKRGLTVMAITNGVELDLFADLIGPGALREVQITLDGMSGVHDKRRVGPGFKQTFDVICDNIDLALSKGTNVSLRMNVDSVNAADLGSLNDFCRARGWADNPRFRAHAAAVSHEGNYRKESSRSRLVCETMDLAEAGPSVFSSYEKPAEQLIEAAVFEGRYPYQTVANCSAETGLLMFDPLGDVYSCWEEIGEKDKRIATYGDGTLRLVGERATTWLTRHPGMIEDCAACPYALIHNSGCGKHADTASGTVFASACEEFKTYFPITLARTFLRLEQEMERRVAAE